MAKNLQITESQLKSIVKPGGKSSVIAGAVEGFNDYAATVGINTPLRAAHFIAQLAHESDHFNTTVEYGGSRKRYAPWYGRGLIQTTWQENYASFYKWAVEKGFKDVPEFFTSSGREKVAQFPWAFLCAIWYWDAHNLNRLADQDNVRAITRAINGGYNGLDDRIRYLNLAKKIFKLDTNAVDVESGTILGGKSVREIQEALVKQGYKISVDGKMGPQTLAAITLFQKVNGLVPDGVVGPKTLAVLFG